MRHDGLLLDENILDLRNCLETDKPRPRQAAVPWYCRTYQTDKNMKKKKRHDGLLLDENKLKLFWFAIRHQAHQAPGDLL